MNEQRQPYDEAFLADCARIHRQWHECAKPPGRTVYGRASGNRSRSA